MGFWIAMADNTGARNVSTEWEVTPRPTTVEYPAEPTGTRIETAGTVVVQQTARDTRVRAWRWQGYPGWFAPYQTLWSKIEPLRSRYRKLSGATTPYVYLKEDESKLFHRVTVDTGTGAVSYAYDWFRCRVLESSRLLRTEGSSLVVYAETVIRFVIDDTNYNDFG